MTRRCSHCSNNGHNSRTCTTKGGGLKLFGVRITDGFIKKSASMGNLSSHFYSSSSASPNPNSPDHHRDPTLIAEGYVSDDPNRTSCSSSCRIDRKKGTPWTEEEHRMFLMGLQKLGKGDWRGISRNFVVSRTPTQVASHAQKYFIRHSNATRRKRRSSLFDMVPETSIDSTAMPEEQLKLHPEPCETENVSTLPTLHLSLDRDSDHMDTTYNENVIPKETTEEIVKIDNNFTPIPLFLPTYLPLPFSFWQPISPISSGGGEKNGTEETTISNHQVLKPTPVLPKDRLNVDEMLGMSNLSLGNGGAEIRILEPSPLSMELLDASSRQSAFHVNQPDSGSSLRKSSKTKAIHAV